MFKRYSDFVNIVFMAIFLTLVVSNPGYSGIGTAFDDIIRKVAKVSDDIPIKKSEKFLDEVGNSAKVKKAAEEALDIDPKAVLRSSDTILKRVIGGVSDADLIKQLDELPAPERMIRLAQIKGAKQLEVDLPDVALRGRLLSNGGEDALLAAGLHGSDSVRAMLEFDEMLQTGQIAMRQGISPISVSDLARTITNKGKASLTFWNNYIRPNWKKLAVGGVIAWFVIDPDGFTDTAGNITEEGTRRCAELGGVVLSSAIKGASEGGGNAIRQLLEVFKASVFSSWINIMGLVIIITVILGILISLSASAARTIIKPFVMLYRGIMWIKIFFTNRNKDSKGRSRDV